MERLQLTFEEKWEIFLACDSTYDGLFYTAVKTTKIYCRPSCKSRKPKKANVEFYDNLLTVEEAGFRACKRCQPEISWSPQEELVKKVTGFLINHYKQKLTLQDIAAYIGMCPYHLERTFKQQTNETPRSYLEKLRVDRAVFLLKYTNKTNLEICYEAGFQSSSSFYHSFRKITEVTPSQFRVERM